MNYCNSFIKNFIHPQIEFTYLFISLYDSTVQSPEKSKSRIILGGGSFLDIEPKELEKLLTVAAELEIDRIDTAPTYGNSEKVIGQVAQHCGRFHISTKIWHKDPSQIDERYVFDSIKNSLQALNIGSVETIYLHSLEPKLIKAHTYRALLKVKNEGFTRNIGVSSDGKFLQFYYSLGIFDTFMATLNLVDQANFTLLDRISKHQNLKVVTKRSIANGVWRKDLVGRYIRIYDILFNSSVAKSEYSYQSRHKLLSRSWGSALSHEEYYKFAFLWNRTTNVVIGTRKVSHLKISRDRELSYADPTLQVKYLRDLWLQNYNSLWSPLT